MSPARHQLQSVLSLDSATQVLYMTGWSPHESQQKPASRGSATVSFQVRPLCPQHCLAERCVHAMLGASPLTTNCPDHDF